jgi:hypothetical protein
MPVPSSNPGYTNLTSYTSGTPLINTRQLAFGTYLFPLTFQEQDRGLKLALDQKRVPFLFGDHMPPNSNVKAREITLVGTLGTGVIGSSGTTLETYNDLETERTLLAGLQNMGRQSLFTRFDRFQNAYLSEFEFKFMQDGGLFRYADYQIKFIADDPRYYGLSAYTISGVAGAGIDALVSTGPTHLGNTNAFPTFTFTCTAGTGQVGGTGPYVELTSGASTLIVGFSKLVMFGGDTLVVQCDPRPEYRCRGAVYTPNGQPPQNAFQYCQTSDFTNGIDFTEFFPFVPPGSGSGITLVMGMTSMAIGGASSVSGQMQWWDTWL